MKSIGVPKARSDPGSFPEEGQYRTFFEAIPTAVFVCDRNAVIQHYNQYAVQLWGREPQRGVEKHCGSLKLYLLDGTWLPHERSPLVEVLKTGIPVRNVEVFIERPDGSRLPVAVNFAALINPGGEIMGAITSFSDITERRKAEQQSRESEARHLALAARKAAENALRDTQARLVAGATAASVGTWIWEIPTDQVFADAYLAKLFDLPAEQSQGAPLGAYLEAVHPDDLPRVKAMIEESMQRGHSYDVEYRLRSGEEWRWFAARGEVNRDENGRALRLLGALIDITDRRRQDEKVAELSRQLKAQAEMFNITLSHITDFAYTFNRDGRFVFVNKPLLDLWGLELSEAIGKNFFDLKYPDDLAARLQRQIQQVVETKSGLTDETPYTSPTGVQGYYEYIFQPVFSVAGEVEAITGSTRDITDRKRGERTVREMEERAREAALLLAESQEELERRVRQRTAELDAANKALTAQILEARRAEGARKQLQGQLATAQEDERSRISRELHDEIGQLLVALQLELTAVETSGISTTAAMKCKSLRGTVDTVAREIHEIAHKLRPTALDDLGLVRTLSNYVEQWSVRATIRADFHMVGMDGMRLPPQIETTLYRIAQEALNNVLRHARATRVSVILERENDLVRIILEDDGQGFEVDALSAPKHAKRLGILGMKERAALVGGEVKIESEPTRGTTVFVRIPLSEKSDDA